MNVKELIEKRNAALLEAESVLAGDKTPENREKFDRIMADSKSIEGDIARYNSLTEAKEARSKATATWIPNPSESNDPEERAEVKKASQRKSMLKWMQTGVAEQRDLTVSGTSSITLPVSFQPQVYEALQSWGEVYNLVNVLRLPHSEPRKLVLANDTANGWANVSVGTDVSDVDPTLTGITLSADTISTSLVKIGVDMLNDSGFDVDSWVKNELGKRYARGAATAIVKGGGPNGYVQGIVAGLSSSANISSQYTANIQYQDVLKLFTTLDPAYNENAVFAMNNNTIYQLAQLSDTNGRPLWLPNFGSLSGEVGEYKGGGFFGSVLGRPVKLVTQLANTGSGNTSVLFGDFKSGYTYREPEQGIQIQRLNERYAPSFEVGFIGFAKCGGTVTDAGTHPIIGMWHS